MQNEAQGFQNVPVFLLQSRLHREVHQRHWPRHLWSLWAVDCRHLRSHGLKDFVTKSASKSQSSINVCFKVISQLGFCIAYCVFVAENIQADENLAGAYPVVHTTMYTCIRFARPLSLNKSEEW